MTLPADSHVHTEWSWDASHGSMERTCARAVALGLPAVAFTEHVDHTVWSLDRAHVDEGAHLLTFTSPAGLVTPGPFDAVGYLDAVAECRDRYPGLRILSGLELGEPHLHTEAVGRVLAAGTFDRVLGSLHCLPDGDGWTEPGELFGLRPAAEIVRTYLRDVAAMVAVDDAFSVLAHIDYPVRSWDENVDGPFDPADFEQEFRRPSRPRRRPARLSRSTPCFRCTRRSCAGGTRWAATRSASAVMRTSRNRSAAGSMRRLTWPRRVASAPETARTTCGPASTERPRVRGRPWLSWPDPQGDHGVGGTSWSTRSMSRSTAASAPKGLRGSENVRRWWGSRAAMRAAIMRMKKMISMAESLRPS